MSYQYKIYTCGVKETISVEACTERSRSGGKFTTKFIMVPQLELSSRDRYPRVGDYLEWDRKTWDRIIFTEIGSERISFRNSSQADQFLNEFLAKFPMWRKLKFAIYTTRQKDKHENRIPNPYLRLF